MSPKNIETGLMPFVAVRSPVAPFQFCWFSMNPPGVKCAQPVENFTFSECFQEAMKPYS